MAHTSFIVPIPSERYNEIFKIKKINILKDLFKDFDIVRVQLLLKYYVEKYILGLHSGKGRYKFNEYLGVFMKTSNATPPDIDSPKRWARWHTMSKKVFRPGQLEAINQRARDIKEIRASRYSAELAMEKGIKLPETFIDDGRSSRNMDLGVQER